MIFDRKVYKKANVLSSIIKKYSLFMINIKPIIPKKFENIYPATIKELTNQQVDELNLICHAKAFEMKKNKSYLNLSKCNSCHDCKSYSGIILSKSLDCSTILDIKYLPLHRE